MSFRKAREVVRKERLVQPEPPQHAVREASLAYQEAFGIVGTNEVGGGFIESEFHVCSFLRVKLIESPR
jgi:hypothetical protein